MPAKDFKDFNIRGVNHPRYNKYKLTENNPIEVILQKIETILLTNKGDVFGDANFGCNLEHYLWSTSAPTDTILRTIYEQVNNYVPEAINYGFSVTVDIYQGTYRDIMYVNINIQNSAATFLLK